ncbi:MAG TPA: nucleotide exchange factor GrpE [bacterium]|nr:nucleotide exchange factor GrpE [bacterium]
MKEEQEQSDKDQAVVDSRETLPEAENQETGREENFTENEAEETEKAADDNAAAIAALTAENQKLRDQLLRLAAEFDNYRKRSDRELTSCISNANFDLMARLLPALDDLNRIVAAGEDGAEPAALVEGINLLHKNILKAFQEGGLEPMQTIGEEFDPLLHDALLHVEVPESGPNKVVEEHKKGYYFKGRVLRHAQVVVSK